MAPEPTLEELKRENEQLRAELVRAAVKALDPGRWYECDLCGGRGTMRPEGVRHNFGCLLARRT